MKSLFGTLVMFCAMVVFTVFAWNHMKRVPLVAPAVVPKPTTNKNESPLFDGPAEAQPAIRFAGPLATYMGQTDSTGATAGIAVENLQPPPLNPADHVGGSVV